MTDEEIEKKAEKKCKLNDQIHRDCYVAGFKEGVKCGLKQHAHDYLVKTKELKDENNKLLDVINNQDVKIADLEEDLKHKKIAIQTRNKRIADLEKEKEETRKKVIEIFANDEMQQGELWKACGLRLVGWDYEKNQLDHEFMILYGVSN